MAKSILVPTLTAAKNIDALNSVLKMLEKEEVDKIICLGDFIGRSRKI